VITVIRAVPKGHGLGVMWWDGTWTVVPAFAWDNCPPFLGNTWENQALFDFSDRALAAMILFKSS